MGALENNQKQLQEQVRTMLAAVQDRTQYRPTNDSALMNGLFDTQLRSFLASKKTTHNLRPIVQWVVRIVEKCCSFVNLFSSSRGGTRIWKSHAEAG